MRLFFLWQHPFTNDEGAYLMDAKLVGQGQLPSGDVLTKAPIPTLLFASSVWITGGSLFANRIVTLVANLLTTVPLAYLAWRLRGPSAVVISGGLWLLVTMPIPIMIVGHTETVATFFIASFLALWWYAVDFVKPSRKQWWAAYTSGFFLALAFASRKTSIAAIIPAICLYYRAYPKQRRVNLLPCVAGVATVWLPWFLFIQEVYGLPGLQEAIGVGYGDIWLNDSARLSPGAGLPWVINVWRRVGQGSVLAAAISAIWLVYHVLHGQKQATPYLLWLLTLTLLYMGWPTLLPEYLIDFSLPLTILATLAVTDTYRWRRPWGVVLIALLLVSSLFSAHSAYQQAWTGMFTEEAIEEAAHALQEQVPLSEPILTAAVIVPYLSGHDVLFNISHPLWYRYDFINPTTKETFLPPLSDIEVVVQSGQVKWALIEHLTDFSYLRHPSQLITLFGNQWSLVTVIPNDTGFRSNPLKLYQGPVANVVLQ